MYQPNTNFFSPKNPDIKIWRYLDFTKFVSILEKSALFFTRSDKFEDRFEGVSPKAEIDYRINLYRDRFLFDSEKSLDLIIKREQHQRKNMAISCWHMNEYESMAMWNTYLKSGQGLAIQSTFSDLRDSFHVDSKNIIWIGEVQYIDYDQDLFNDKLFLNFTHKRQFYSYERELRAFNFRYHPKIGKSELSIGEFESLNGFEFGDYIKVDLDILIDQIVLAPNCSNWFFELVKNVSKKYGLKKKIKKSELDKDIYQ